MTDSAQDRLARLETLLARIGRLERIAVLRHELSPVPYQARPEAIELENLVAEIRQTLAPTKEGR